MDKKQEAVKVFQSGNNCAQSVLAAYAGELGYDKQLALALSSGFGAGMGRLQETCGAVSGAFMVIGIHNDMVYEEKAKGKEASVVMIQDYTKKFTEAHGSIRCKDLLQCNLNTDEGQKQFKEQGLGVKVCESCIVDSIEILETIFPNGQAKE